MKSVLIVLFMATMHVLTMRTIVGEQARTTAPTAPMSLSEMTARAAALTGRLMACFGEPGSAQCRPVELNQTDHPEVRVTPVAVCFAGMCSVVSR